MAQAGIPAGRRRLGALMAKTRLSSYIRARLMDLAKDILTFPTEQAACDRAYGHALSMVKTAMIARFPPEDMKTLARYDCAKSPMSIYLTKEQIDGPRPYILFTFRVPGEAPLIKCGTMQNLIVGDKIMNTAMAYNDAVEATKLLKETKLKDYAALVNGVGSLEDVEAVWPEAARVRDKLIGGAVSTLNPEVIERIKADVAGRKRKRPASK
jgi:hypothetical protein